MDGFSISGSPSPAVRAVRPILSSFFARYAAWFGNAVIHITRNKEQKIKNYDVELVDTVGLEPNVSRGFSLTVALDATPVGVDQPTAKVIVAEAHKVCPYSNATRGNIDVVLGMKTR